MRIKVLMTICLICMGIQCFGKTKTYNPFYTSENFPFLWSVNSIEVDDKNTTFNISVKNIANDKRSINFSGSNNLLQREYYRDPFYGRLSKLELLSKGINTIQSKNYTWLNPLQEITFQIKFNYLLKENETYEMIIADIFELENIVINDFSSLKNFLKSKLSDIPSYNEYIKSTIEKEINEWQKKGEFENTSAWQKRVNETTRKEKIIELTEKHKREYIEIIENYNKHYKELCEEFYSYKIQVHTKGFNKSDLKLATYDADNQSFLISSSDDSGEFLLHVPIDEAPSFKNNWNLIRETAELNYEPNGDDVILTSISFTNGNKQYKFDGTQDIKYAVTEVDYNFNPIEIALSDDSQIQYNFEPIYYQQNNTIGIKGNKVTVENNKISIGSISDVDKDIPQNYFDNNNTFAVIIGNEIYQNVANVPFAENDARILASYFEKTLGIPSKNIRYYNNATYAQILSAIKDIQEISKAYHGNIDVIFYYAGHGIPNESDGESFILPVDADGRQIEVCYPINKLYADLGNLGTNSVTIFLDACFSGSVRGNEMLTGARGIKIKSKQSDPIGNMIILSAASGDETAYPFKEKGHGLFTYFLLKKLQESKGDVTIGELSEYIIDSVSKESIVSNGKSQTPTVQVSPSLSSTWKQTKLMK